MVVLDTNIIIDHLRQGGAETTILSRVLGGSIAGSIGLSVVSVQELYEGKSTRRPKEEDLLLGTLLKLQILPYDYETALTAGRLARDIGRAIEFPDAAIAATALTHGGQLLTLNKKDFQNIKGLDLL